MGQAMSQIQMFFSNFLWSNRSGLLAVSVLRRLNWKSHTSFAFSFTKIIPRSHCSSNHRVSVPINLFSFAKVTASITSAMLCLVKYSLVKTLHPPTRWFTVSSYPWHTRHRPSSVIARATFQSSSFFNHLFQHWRDRWRWTGVSPANICWSWRRLEDVFTTCLENVFNTSST